MWRLRILAAVGLGLWQPACSWPAGPPRSVRAQDAQETSPAEPARKLNVLFVSIDDLRPQLGCYGLDFMHTPVIDSLAERGVLFERAYCMVSICGASRASVMTSLRPSPRRFRTHSTRAGEEVPDALPLHTLFKQNGYTTLSLGKVFHYLHDCEEGWSEPPRRSALSDYQDTAAYERDLAEYTRRYPLKGDNARGAAYEDAQAPDSAYRDGENAARAIEYLERFATQRDQPFFLAVGFRKPHLPFSAPRRYWDLYDDVAIDLPPNSEMPTDVPIGATHNSGELRAYSGIPSSGPLEREDARRLIQGYYACVSFVDAQLGRVLAALERLGLADDTLVVVWGDHGYQLGEHGMWNKQACFETSMHAPLIVMAPRTAGVRPGTRVTGLVEFIDIYPTICELVGLPIPEHVEGRSLVPVMRRPQLGGRPFAIGRYGAGDTIRDERYRYTEYRDRHGAGKLYGTMLYDLDEDPGERENLAAGDPAEGDLAGGAAGAAVESLRKNLERHKGRGGVQSPGGE